VTLSIRRAQPPDAALLARFAARTFFETYADANDPADMADHLSAKYGEAIQDAEIRNPMASYLLAEVEGGLAGYAYLLFEHAPEGVALDRPVELVRFYVAREWHGRGVAQALMTACVDEARRGGGNTLWLAVWQENARAISFYRKAGFELAGTVRFKLGAQLQDDHLMMLALGPVESVQPVARR
jgi:ribosomal protein S18 acetylase RimI-like enzyme